MLLSMTTITPIDNNNKSNNIDFNNDIDNIDDNDNNDKALQTDQHTYPFLEICSFVQNSNVPCRIVLSAL